MRSEYREPGSCRVVCRYGVDGGSGCGGVGCSNDCGGGVSSLGWQLPFFTGYQFCCACWEAAVGDAVIELVEREVGSDGSFAVRVVYPGEGVEYEVTVTDPASVADEELLAWYFERHLRYPFLDGDRRAAAVKLLRGYGIALFGQVFGGAAGRGYERLRGQGFDGCRIEVVAGAGLHRLHWEALFDPELDAPLALRVPITRRVQLQPARFEIAAAQPTLNILLVTARPRGASDVGYRTISRPLVEAVRQASLPVRVDVVRPGTWAGLRAHLEAARDRHKSGWYQLVHFDVHGAFADHAALTAGSRAGRYLFAPGENPEFVGKQGFLFFETAEVGKADPRSAVEVANLLAEYRVPIAVLNACQSAMQTDNEVALAQQLVQAGVPVVVGMAYSVTVTAAELAMPVLYERLVQGADPEAGLRAMRRCLFDTPERQVYFDQTLPLSDWVLPVVFRQRSVSLELRAMTPPEIDKFEARQAQVGDEPRVTYGSFVGRDLDVQAIEQMLLVDVRRNQILVRGMAGAGKSTLLAHLGWWWQCTGLVEETFTFNYLERAWTVDQIVRTIAAKVWPDKIEFATWDSLSETAKRERVARVLRSQRHLLIIDNTESITATLAAIPHALPEADRKALQTWMSRLRGGKSLVVWGSREAETWVAAHSFGDNVYELGGLDPQAASILADRILTHHHATATLHDPSQRDSLDQLLTLLDGYPLPLEVVLPNLATTAPATVLAELNAGGATADPIGLIGAAIGYSHSKLDPTLQHSLALLAPFTAVIPGGDILAEYQRLLGEAEPTQDRWGSLDLAAGVAAAVEIGLATAHDTLRGWVQTVPILPYFLRRILHEHPLWWQAAIRAHYQLHARLGPQLFAVLTSNDPGQRSVGRAATHAAYANLRTAIDTALDHGQPALPVLKPVEELLDQTHQHTARQQLLSHAITALETRTDPASRRELPDLLHLAGMVAQAQRRFEQAEDYYRQSLDLKLEFGDRHGAAVTYHQLGIVAQEQRRYEQAEDYYRQSLDLELEFGDRHGAASTYHQLGRVAEEQRRYEQAEDYYRQSLDLKLEFGDRHGAALT
ncbi:tetratricopeptide repeat protein, partial [Nocardia brasiliensis]|uniref:tetratricopeptide repeat protein n=1 Tax=Nocardia brasiliensis TaxID=37326 RepID=UPI002454C403